VRARRDGHLDERVFRLPVTAPPRPGWFSDDPLLPHPLEAAGIRVDEEMTPEGMRNVRVIGSALAGMHYLDQLKKGSPIDQIVELRLSKPGVGPHSVMGPILVRGAEPGDVLEVQYLKIAVNDWGTCFNNPGKVGTGALADVFPEGQVRYLDIDHKKLLVWLRDGGDPTKTELEASTRSQWLAGETGVSYIHVRGITFRYAANHAQRGAFVIGQSHGGNPSTTSRGWVVEDCVFEKANSSGGSFSGESHLFRRCVFQDNGQLGFGTSFCHNTVMEECGVYRNNTKGYSTGWEAGGLKVTFSRGFVFDRCRVMDNRGCGIWYDIGNEKSEVKNCYIANNDEGGIFYEISYGLHAHDNLIVNNANRGEHVGDAWGTGGVTLSSSEGCTIEYNTMIGNRDGIAFREQDRSTPRIDDSRKDFRILNRDHVLRNNVVAYSQAYNVAFWMDTNFFGPHPGGGDANRPIFENPATLNIRFENNLLWPIAGRPNYLYGAPWRSKSKQFKLPNEFAQSCGVADTSRVGDPLFTDVVAGDYRLRDDSPAKSMNAGVRDGIR
jgi:parallel beta-helix repeat protein